MIRHCLRPWSKSVNSWLYFPGFTIEKFLGWSRFVVHCLKTVHTQLLGFPNSFLETKFNQLSERNKLQTDIRVHSFFSGVNRNSILVILTHTIPLYWILYFLLTTFPPYLYPTFRDYFNRWSDDRTWKASNIIIRYNQALSTAFMKI